MGFTKRRHYNKNPQRRKIPGVGAEERRVRHRPVGVTLDEGGVGTEVDATFDCQVIWNGELPLWYNGTLIPANRATAVEITGPDTATITFSGAVGSDVNVAFEDPAFRNNSGGYVNQGAVVVTPAP